MLICIALSLRLWHRGIENERQGGNDWCLSINCKGSVLNINRRSADEEVCREGKWLVGRRGGGMGVK